MKTTPFKSALEPLERWFWKAQISVLRACPPLCGVVSGLSIGAENSHRVWAKTLLRTAVKTPRAILLHWRNKRERRVVLSRISVILTTRCTLNCDKCLAHIPDLKDHWDVPADEFIRDIRSLFSCVDYIYAIIISGGEAFLHPHLVEILRACADPVRVGDISVQTNGTVIPGEKVLSALREVDATVKISRYAPALQPDVEKLKLILKENGIRTTHESSAFWRDTGCLGQRQDGSETRRFSVCVQQLCSPLIGGKLFLCSESAVLMEEGFVPECEDYVDLRAVCPAEFRERWQKLLKKRAVAACSYCLGNTYKTKKIPVAVQRESLGKNAARR